MLANNNYSYCYNKLYPKFKNYNIYKGLICQLELQDMRSKRLIF